MFGYPGSSERSVSSLVCVIGLALDFNRVMKYSKKKNFTPFIAFCLLKGINALRGYLLFLLPAVNDGATNSYN